MMKNKAFPKWSGPIIGLVVGGYVGAKNLIAANAGVPPFWAIGGGMLIGGLAGCLVFVLDPKPSLVETDELPSHLVSASRHPSGLVGRVLALFGILLCWFPILGVVVNGVGALVNRRADDWASLVSNIGCVISVLVTIFTVAGFWIDWMF